MILIKNKKGAISDTDKILFWIIFVLPACGLLVTLISIIMPQLIDSQTSISPGLEKSLYMSTITGSPLCLAYEEPITNRVYNGHIDVNKLTDTRLDDCLQLRKKSEIGFFITVYKEGTYYKEILTQNVLNKVSAHSLEIKRPVILVEDGEKSNGLLVFRFY